MSSTTPYKLIRMGVMIALIAGSAVACHYKAGEQYKDDNDVPGADSGTRRISTTTMPADSTDTMNTAPMVTLSPTAKPESHATSANLPTATKPVTKAKFSRGHATVTAPKIYGTAEVQPQFPGGQRALDSYITKNVNYPQQAIDDDVSGTIHVSFIVDEEGHVTKAKVMDGARVSDGLDEEALRVVRDMPDWQPGKVKGKSVKTRMELPINFQVES